MDFESIKKWRMENFKDHSSQYAPIGEHFKEIDWMIAEIERLRDVHDHYLFELNRANEFKKENTNLMIVIKEIQKGK